MRQQALSLTVVFKALGDPTRLRIALLFQESPMLCVTQIAQKCLISLPSASQHLKVLEHAGVVEKERVGQQMCYRLQKKNPPVSRIMKLIRSFRYE